MTTPVSRIIRMGILVAVLGVSLFSGCDSGEWEEDDESDSEVEEDEEEILADDEDSASEPIEEDEFIPRDFSFSLPLFSPESAWNQSVRDAQVLPESEEQILSLYRVLLGDKSTTHPKQNDSTAPFIFINYEDWTVPIFRAVDGEQVIFICTYDGNPDYTNPKLPEAAEYPGGPVTIPITSKMVRPAGPQGSYSDGFLVLYHPETFIEYDFWQATTQRSGECESDGGGLVGSEVLEAGSADIFDVQGLGANPTGYYSARASGLPLLGGLLLPEDVESGAISHALAVALPYPRITNPRSPDPEDVIYPASSAEVDFYNTDPFALAQGQRVRLKDSLILADELWGDADVSATPIPLEELPVAPITIMFLTALKEYGAIVVDNDSAFSFYAEDIHTADLHLTDEEVNILIGNPPDTPLPSGLTRWQIVMDKLSEDLLIIPIASGGDGPWWEYEGQGNHPDNATIGRSNFEVVEPASEP